MDIGARQENLAVRGEPIMLHESACYYLRRRVGGFPEARRPCGISFLFPKRVPALRGARLRAPGWDVK